MLAGLSYGSAPSRRFGEGRTVASARCSWRTSPGTVARKVPSPLARSRRRTVPAGSDRVGGRARGGATPRQCRPPPPTPCSWSPATSLCGNTDPNFNGGNPDDCQQRATANLVHNIAPNYLLPGGDTQYDADPVEGGQPTTTDYTDGYDGSWGQLQNPGSSNYVAGLVVRPTPGDNEYGDANENDRGSVSTASNYYANFGASGLNDLPAGVDRAPRATSTASTSP